MTATDRARPRVTHSYEGGTIVVRIETPPAVIAPPDELLPFPFGIEARTAKQLVRSGKLTAAKLGRRLYARRSDLLALVDRLAEPPTAGSVADDYASLAARARATTPRRRGGAR